MKPMGSYTVKRRQPGDAVARRQSNETVDLINIALQATEAGHDGRRHA